MLPHMNTYKNQKLTLCIITLQKYYVIIVVSHCKIFYKKCFVLQIINTFLCWYYDMLYICPLDDQYPYLYDWKELWLDHNDTSWYTSHMLSYILDLVQLFLLFFNPWNIWEPVILEPLLKVFPIHFIVVITCVFLGLKDESGDPTHLTSRFKNNKMLTFTRWVTPAT